MELGFDRLKRAKSFQKVFGLASVKLLTSWSSGIMVRCGIQIHSARSFGSVILVFFFYHGSSLVCLMQ